MALNYRRGDKDFYICFINISASVYIYQEQFKYK